MQERCWLPDQASSMEGTAHKITGLSRTHADLYNIIEQRIEARQSINYQTHGVLTMMAPIP